MDGHYDVFWSSKPIGETSEEGVKKIAEGEVPKPATTLTATFTIPESPYGINYLQVIRRYRPTVIYGFSFNVIPDLKISPASGSPGSKITIKGTGFPDESEDIKLSFDGTDTKQSIVTDELGSFDTQFTVPDTIAGKHEFTVTTSDIFIGDISANLQVKPRAVMTPEHPDIGSEVTLSGCGFAASSQVTIKYDDITITDSSSGKSLTTDANGSFSHVFKVPESPKANHVITATDKAGNVATLGTSSTPLELEGSAPPSPNPIFPCDGQRFGWFGPQTIIFKWEPVEDPSGVTYTLDVGTNTSVFPLVVRKTGLTGTTCTVRLEPGTYYWQVSAIDGAGNESEPTLALYPFKVGFFSVWFVVGGILVFAIIFILIVRAFFRRVREYYK